MSRSSAAYRSSSRRCLWLVLFVVWAIGTATATRADSLGSGVIIGTHGEVLTNAHVVENCTSITVRSSSVSTAYLVARDEKNDLAIIRSNLALSSVAVFREGPVRPGDTVVALGYPLPGLLATTANLTVGNVSALAGLGNDSRYLQISAPIQPGNSGGPLVDASGHLIGIVTAKLNAQRVARATGDVPQNVNFALKASVAQTFLDGQGIGYRTARSERPLSPADVGEIARPFTVQIECSGNSTNNEARTARPSSPPPVQQVKVLPACNSPGVTKVLIRIGLQLGVVVFRAQGGQVSSTANMRFCRGVEWGSTGKRLFTFTVRWVNPETNQFWVQVTWYSAPIP